LHIAASIIFISYRRIASPWRVTSPAATQHSSAKGGGANVARRRDGALALNAYRAHGSALLSIVTLISIGVTSSSCPAALEKHRINAILAA